MNAQDQISLYIDNELSTDQEQEFLISLAANESLRRNFRSELVMKNVLHTDGISTQPPRELRTAVFAAIGLTLGGAIAGSSTAQAAGTGTNGATATHGSGAFFKTLFASKIHTLLTLGVVGVSAIGGYSARSILTPELPATIPAVSHVQDTPKQQPVQVPSSTVNPETSMVTPTTHSSKSHHKLHTTALIVRPEPASHMRTTGTGIIDNQINITRNKH